MLTTTLQFFVTVSLSMICAQALQMSSGDLPLLTYIIPIIWLMGRVSVGTVLIACSLLLYGFTLPTQPVELSVSTLVLLPLLLVAFCPRSNLVARGYLIMTMVLMEMAVIYCQYHGALEGSINATLIQIAAIVVFWVSTRYTRIPVNRNWWALALTLILVSQGEMVAALMSIAMVSIIFSVATFPKHVSGDSTMNWPSLLSWTIPTAAYCSVFATQEVHENTLILLIWLVTLGAAWICDYILRLSD